MGDIFDISAYFAILVSICVGDSRGDPWSSKTDSFSKCILLRVIFILFDKSIFKHHWSKVANKDSKFYAAIKTIKKKKVLWLSSTYIWYKCVNRTNKVLFIMIQHIRFSKVNMYWRTELKSRGLLTYLSLEMSNDWFRSWTLTILRIFFFIWPDSALLPTQVSAIDLNHHSGITHQCDINNDWWIHSFYQIF